MKTGRKGKYEEIRIRDRYAALSEPFFAFLKEMLEGEDKKDRMWATEQLGKAFTRMIPTELTGEGGRPIIIRVEPELAEQNGIASSTSNNSEGQESV